VELDPVDERVVADGTGVSGSPPQRLPVLLTCASDIAVVDGGEGDELDRVHLDPTTLDPVTATHLHLRPTPQPERDGDPTGQHVVA